MCDYLHFLAVLYVIKNGDNNGYFEEMRPMQNTDCEKLIRVRQTEQWAKVKNLLKQK